MMGMKENFKPMKCIAIDDEPLALKVLSEYVNRIPYLQLVDTFENPFEALQTINSLTIDIIFIDIDMPGLSGLELVESLPNDPKIIFTTAYSEYAINGFELDAIDYLLKPFSFERFLKAVNKVNKSKTVVNQNHQSALTRFSDPADFIFVHSEHYMVKVLLNNIYYIEGFKEYVKIHTDKSKPILTIRSLKSLTEQLNAQSFIRIHRSYIISINKIQDIRNWKLKIKDRYLPIGDSYKEVFNEMVLKGRI